MDDTSATPRLVLVTSAELDSDASIAALEDALSGGDVASVILHAPAGEVDYQAFCERAVPVAQAAGAAALVVDDTRAAGRCGADGIHLTDGGIDTLRETLSRHSPRLIVGGSGFETRHAAMEAGEAMPDYLFFGRLGGDTLTGAHPKTLSLASWWASMMEVPCIAFGGSTLESVGEVAATGAEFVALSAAIFAHESPADAVRQANALLADHARETVG